MLPGACIVSGPHGQCSATVPGSTLVMEVRAGWATDYGHIKYDVSTDEHDLARILTEAGVSATFQAKVTAEEAWAVLDAEARWLAEHAKARYLRDSGNMEIAEAAVDRGRSARRERDETLHKILKRLGLEPRASA